MNVKLIGTIVGVALGLIGGYAGFRQGNELVMNVSNMITDISESTK